MTDRKTACGLKPPGRKTIGAISSELAAQQDRPISPIEQMYENLTDYENNVTDCVQKHKNVFPGDFYIVVITKKEPLMHNVLRNYFFARLSCPTPDYDQTLYKYTQQNDQLEFLWVIPSRDTCFLMLENRQQIAPAEYTLLQYVLKFHQGALFKLAQSLNNEIQ